MHVGNLRTALFEYLIARSQHGQFVLRIEDTDQERLVEGAVDVIYQTLQQVGMEHDEGPDIGGEYGPYVQSQRKDLYLPYAQKLVDEGKAYYCFCTKERLSSLHDENGLGGYDRHCPQFAEGRGTGPFASRYAPMSSGKKCRWKVLPRSTMRCLAISPSITRNWKTRS